MTSKQVVNALRIASASFSLVLVGFKFAGDIHKHGTHEHHNQLCDCVALCYACIWQNATMRKPKAKVSNGR